MPLTLEKDIINDYNNGNSMLQLTKKYSQSRPFIRKLLVRNGIAIVNRNAGRGRFIDNPRKLEALNKIKLEYSLGNSIQKLSLKYSVRADSISKHLKLAGIPIYTESHLRGVRPNRVLHIPTNTFKHKTQEVAYWAGFLMADGCVHGTRLSLTLKDKDHIEKFCRFLGLPPSYVKSYQDKTTGRFYHYVKMRSQEIVNDLAFWGIIPNKTYNYKEPEIPKHLISSYLRGWIDGDGSIYITNRHKYVSVSGLTPAIIWFQQALRVIGYQKHITVMPHRESKQCTIISISGGKQVGELLQLVYGKTNLTRKWTKPEEYYKLCSR